MRNIVVVWLLIFSIAGIAEAEELSVMGNISSSTQPIKDKKDAPVTVPTIIKSEDVEEESADQLDSMKIYLESERKKQDEINGLTREIQKYGLELQKKELIQKINEISTKPNLSGTTGLIQSTAAGNAENKSSPAVAVSVSYIAISANIKEALLTIEGAKVLAKEGQVLASGQTVKNINFDNVVLEDKSGNIVTVLFNSVGL